MLKAGTQVSFSPVLSAFPLLPWKLRSHTGCSSGTVLETPWPCVLAQGEAGILGREWIVTVCSEKRQPVTRVRISSKERMDISGKDPAAALGGKSTGLDSGQRSISA